MSILCFVFTSGMESHQGTAPLRALLWLPCSQHRANAFVTQTDPKGHFSGSWPNQDCLPTEEHTLFGEKPLVVSFVWHQSLLRGAFFFFFFKAASCISSLEPCSSFCFEYKAYSRGTFVFLLGNNQCVKLPVVELAHLLGRESKNKH